MEPLFIVVSLMSFFAAGAGFVRFADAFDAGKGRDALFFAAGTLINIFFGTWCALVAC